MYYLAEMVPVTVSGNSWTTVDVALSPATSTTEDQPPASREPMLATSNPVRADQVSRLVLPFRARPPTSS